MEKSKVYFTKEITPESVVKMYENLGVNLPGKVAVKLHSGEQGNQNYIKPEFIKPIIDKVNGTVVECNTAYKGARNTTEKHKKLISEHNWTNYFNVDIMDEDGDLEIDDAFTGDYIVWDSEKHFKVMKASTWNKIYGDYLKGNIQEHEKSIQNKTH